DGDSDEVNFTALNQPPFLDGVRDLIGGQESEIRDQKSEVKFSPQSPPAAAGGTSADPRQAMLLSGVHLLEALAGWEGGLPWTEELRQRAAAALRRLLEQGEAR